MIYTLLEEPEANDLVKQILEDTPVHDEASNVLKDGDIRLINGRSEREVCYQFDRLLKNTSDFS